MLINHELMNIISYCDGIFICIRCMCNLLVSLAACVLSRASAPRFCSGLTERIVEKVSVGCFVGTALLAGDIKAGARALLAGAEMAGADSCQSREVGILGNGTCLK